MVTIFFTRVTIAKLGDKSCKELVEVMMQHHNPALSSEIEQRYKFHTWQQQLGETNAKYVSELRSLVEMC